MSIDAIDSSTSSAAAALAAQRAAAEAAAAQRRREAAEAAARAAREAREKAEAARRAAEAAANQADMKPRAQLIKHAEDLRKQIAPAQAAALKAEALAHAKDKEATLAESKAQDAKDGRAANAPSDATRKAQVEYDAAKETAAVYEPPGNKKDGPQVQAHQHTHDALDTAQKAMQKVVDIENRGDKPSDAQKQAVTDAVDDYLDASQHEMRLAALDAQNGGGDVKAAVDAKAKEQREALDKGGVFDVDAIGTFVDKARDQVNGESGEMRQIRSEQYTAMQAGLKQLADARVKLPGLKAAADAAEKHLADFKGTPTTDSQIDARTTAINDALDKRAAAVELQHEVDGLALSYEGFVDPKTQRATPGAVDAAYEARAADQTVKERQDAYDTLCNQGAMGKTLDDAGLSLDKAIDEQRLTHADLNVANTQLDKADAKVESDTAQGLYDTTKNAQAPADALFKPLVLPPAANAGAPTLAQLGTQAKDAKSRYDTASTKADQALTAQTDAYNDLVSADGKSAAKLDTTAWLAKDKDLNDKLKTAKSTVDQTRDKLNQARGTGKSADTVHELELTLGKAKEDEKTAQLDVDTLNAMRDLRDAQRLKAAGGDVPDSKLEQLRQAARDKLQKSLDGGPELTPENEKKARDDLKTQTDALKKQDGVVKARQLEYDHAAGTKDEDAAAKKLGDAQDQRGVLDRQVRGLQTLLDDIDAKRLALAADDDYQHHDFGKVTTDTVYDENGQGTEVTVLPRDYNPTQSILPDDKGRPKADGLPKGLKPEDVSVEKKNGKWVAHFNADSDVIGWRDGESVQVSKGDDVELDPVTAQVWQTHTKAVAADKAREDYKQEIADIGAAPGSLGLTDALGARRQQVQQKISDYTKSVRHDPGAGEEPDDIKLARLELKAIDAAADWQQADQTRQGQDAAVRDGLQYTPPGKSPAEVADEKRKAAVQARQDWLNAGTKTARDKANAELKTAQGAHDKWKAEHPYLLASEHDCDTWKALQAAKTKADLADRRTVAGANVQAQNAKDLYIAQNLAPGQEDDPQALYDLFMKNPQVMAQAIINQHYVTYGGQPTQMDGRTHLSNVVGIALGWNPDLQQDASAPDDARRLLRDTDLFQHLTKDQNDTHKSVVDQIVDIGGDHARVTVLPVVYALPGKGGGVVQTALFKVERDSGGPLFVDEKGRKYDSVRDYRANNELPVDNVNLAMPEDGNMTLDANGNVKLFTGDARTETGWEHFRRKSHLDVVVGVAGLVAGTILAVGSLGTLSAPAALLMVASGTMLAASAYGVATSAESLINQADHGVDVNPISNRQARMDWLNMGLSAANVPGLSSATKAAALGWRAANAARAAERAFTAGDEALAATKAAQATSLGERAANTWTPGKWTQRTLIGGNAAATEESVRYMADEWSHMTPQQREQQIFMLGMSTAGFASPVFARGYVAAHNGVKSGVGVIRDTAVPRVASALEPFQERLQALLPFRQTLPLEERTLNALSAGGGDDRAMFTLSDLPPEAVQADGTLRTRRKASYGSLDEARDAAAERGGGLVYCVSPDPNETLSPIRRGRVSSDEIMGALRVDENGEVSLAWANDRSDALTRALGEEPRGRRLLRKPGVPQLDVKKAAALIVAARTAAQLASPQLFDLMNGPFASTAAYYRSAMSKTAWFTHNHAMIDVFQLAARGQTDSALQRLERVIARAPLKGAARLSAAQADDLRAAVRDVAEAGAAYKAFVDDAGLPRASIRRLPTPEAFADRHQPSDDALLAYSALFDKLLQALPDGDGQAVDHRAAERLPGSSMSPQTHLGWLFKLASFGGAANVSLSFLTKASPGAHGSLTEWGAYAADPLGTLPAVFVQWKYLESFRRLTAAQKAYPYETRTPEQQREIDSLEAQKKRWNTAADWTSLGSAVRSGLVAANYFAEGNTLLGVASTVQSASSVGWLLVQQTPRWLRMAPQLKQSVRWGNIGLTVAVPTLILVTKLLWDDAKGSAHGRSVEQHARALFDAIFT